ncbi:SURF1 family protein [Noviherbaspirillum denitrificans]|uniref:SURF1-like protein n=1 Tax=Noviherbaspirillum denitrificans TaxID=1968433 RepID=A0A254TFS8_9BURK|nr:SURF1 family protein [Noviherbaspirillum denitrificans]OWW21501.1 cytochrome oxidase biosynthesis protein [Noviherbaspirillum denitrificans]
MPMKFRFRWIPFVAAVVVAAIGFSLGQWQTRRASEKLAIEAKQQARETEMPSAVGNVIRAPEEVEFRHLKVRGEFVPGWTVYLDNRPYKGAAGFYVMTPLKIAGSELHVLVARGWVKRDAADRAKLPPIPTPPGEVEIEGIARRDAGHILQLGDAGPLKRGEIVQNLDAPAFERASGLKMQPFVLEQVSEAQDGLVRDWPRPSSGVEKHQGYAFQWYALAATALIFFVVTGFRRGKE